MDFLIVDEKKCTRDGLCIKDCPMAVLAVDPETFLPILAKGGEKRCIGCGHCLVVCPTQAISLANLSQNDCIPFDKNLLPKPKQLATLLRTRRSTRQFKSEPVSRVDLGQLVETSQWAPSAKNMHPLQWLVVDTTDVRDKLRTQVLEWMKSMIEGEDGVMAQKFYGPILTAAAAGQDYLFWDAPAMLIAHAKRKISTAPADASIALSTCELLAASMGLGTCWAGYFQYASNHYPPLRELLQLPEQHVVLGAVLIGYPSVNYQRIPPRPAATISWLADDLS